MFARFRMGARGVLQVKVPGGWGTVVDRFLSLFLRLRILVARTRNLESRFLL